MKHFSLFLLILILSGLVGLSHPPKEVMGASHFGKYIKLKVDR